jgi:dipeptidyl aminopeptidase/acylaminoacyl peptidase
MTNTSGRWMCGILGAAGLLACGGHINLGEDPGATGNSTAGSWDSGSGGSWGGGSYNGGSAGMGGQTTPVQLSPCEAQADRKTWIAFDSDRDDFDRELYLVHPDGTGLTRLTNRLGIDKEPAFSADGSWLSFTSDRDGTLQIYTMDLASGDVTQVTHRPEGADQSASSHDGSLLTFHSGASLYVIGTDGSDERLVASGPDPYNGYGRAQFTADDQRLVFDRNNEISVAKLDGSEMRYIVGNTTTFMHGPVLTPNGVDIAYDVACFYEIKSIWTSPFSLTLAACDGVRLTPPGDLPSEHPSWGPGAKRVAYSRVDPPSNAGHIAIVDRVRGSSPCRVTNGDSDDRNPNWLIP